MRDPTKNRHFSYETDTHDNYPSKSMMTIPLFNDNLKVFAVLSAEGKIDEDGNQIFFKREDEYIMKFLGLISSAILKNINLKNRLSLSQHHIDLFRSTTRSLASALQLSSLIRVIVDSAKTILTADRCTLFLDEPEEHRLTANIVYLFNSSQLKMDFKLSPYLIRLE
jgi:GAF domain-containing protein